MKEQKKVGISIFGKFNFLKTVKKKINDKIIIGIVSEQHSATHSEFYKLITTFLCNKNLKNKIIQLSDKIELFILICHDLF